MIEVYIKYTDDNFYLLDIDQSEVINLKTIVKDLNDITKIFSPFTQSFNIQATDKNKRLLGFIGNEKIQRINNDGKFDAKIYINGLLFQVGKLSFEETNYINQNQDKIKTNFASNLTGLAKKLGDLTIQDLFLDSNGNYDSRLDITWLPLSSISRLQSTTSLTLVNGINLKYNIPFISNKRVWLHDSSDLTIPNNIAFNISRNNTRNNSIELEELRPSVSYMTIMRHLLLKIGTPVTCPLFNTPELKDLMVLGNAESLVKPSKGGYDVTGWNALTYYNDLYANNNPARWQITQGGSTGVFKIKRNTSYVNNSDNWSNGFKIKITFNGLTPLVGTTTNITVNLINATNGAVIDSQSITDNTYDFTIVDNTNTGQTMLDSNGELFIKFVIQPNTLVSWSNLKFYTKQTLVASGVFSWTTNCYNYTSSSLFGGDKINLISVLPKIKAKDFLSSFFKMFNILVVPTGLTDGSMYWLTPNDIKAVNQPYSKRIVDYTQYTNKATLTKKRGNDYNQYLLTHKESKYYDAVYGDGTAFGSLTYPTTPPPDAKKFEVSTEYTILKQRTLDSHPNNVQTAYAFERDSPELDSNGTLKFSPVYEEFTLLYTKVINLGSGTNRVGFKISNAQNYAINQVLQPTFFHPTTGKSLAFGGEGVQLDSLYLNYYSDFIELLLNPNTYKSEFEIMLPANEIFLNFGNQNQGESNIPLGFRAQNEIIIGEQRYQLVDSLINLTTGKGKLTLLNF